jgi:hypothetical protein
VIEVKESDLFQFCDLKTNLHIRVHAFPCSKGLDLLPPGSDIISSPNKLM